MATATFHFDGTLIDLLPKDKRKGPFALAFTPGQSLKHLIESLGIPHTEIGHILVNGAWKDLSTLAAEGDQVEVFPLAAGQDPLPPNSQCFLLDNHLGRLAAYLRLLGIDTLYDPELDDAQLAALAAQEERVLLTRDRRLLMRKSVTRGYLVRSNLAEDQAIEVVWRFSLENDIQPFRRCLRCNALLEPVSKEEVIDQLEPLTKLYYEEFSRCINCGQVYWKGTHYDRMLGFVKRVKGSRNTDKSIHPR